MNPRLLALAYLAITLLPLALAWMSLRPPRPAIDEIASGAGMLAFSIILVEFVLSGRFRTVSGRIGMDVTMRLHQLLARTALVLVLIHPFLYSTPFNPPYPWDQTRQLTLYFDAPGLLSGIAGWLLLFPLVVLAINRDLIGQRYETWRFLHGTGAVLVAGLVLHHTLTAGRYSQDPMLAWLWAGLFTAAVLTLLHIYVIVPTLQRRRPWRVTAIRPAALRTWELTVAPVDHPGLTYRAGQFAWLNVGSSPYLLAENPFSISSAPGAGPEVGFLIKELGDFTNTLGQIRPGTPAYLDGPHGNLWLDDREAPGIGLIAGGIGIAPMMGILRELRVRADRRPAKLVYGNRVIEQIVCSDELDAFAREIGTEIIHVLSEPPSDWTGAIGMVEPALIRDVFGDARCRNWLYILCGPAGMMESVEATLISLGISPSRILSERFVYD